MLRSLARNGFQLMSGNPSSWRHLRFELLNRPLLFYLRRLQRSSVVPGLVSIITPTYGRHKQLGQAIKSVDSQTLSCWEHIVVSDGKFESLDLLKAAYGDSRRHFMSSMPTRLVGNYQRNLGVLRSRGEFLVFLDDDNVLYPDALELMLAGFVGGDIGTVFCPIHYDHAKYGVHGQVLMPSEGFDRGEIDTLNAMIRRSLVVRCGGWGNCPYFEDFNLLSRAAAMAHARYLNCPPIGHHR